MKSQGQTRVVGSLGVPNGTPEAGVPNISQKPPKPSKPSPDFPLYAHSRGKWAKKIKGKLLYFGRWEDPAGALREYQDFISGRLPAPVEAGPMAARMTVGDAFNLYLVDRERAVKSGALAPRTFIDYKRTGKRMIEFLGRERAFDTLGPQDYGAYRSLLLETNNQVTVGNETTRVKTILKWLKDTGHIDAYDVGPDFRKPSAKVVRRQRRESGKKLFTTSEVTTFLDEAGIHMRAMILLGINCGYGNNDCNQLPLKVAKAAVDSGWIEYHRPKTEVDRRCPLWDETREALALSLSRRKESSLRNAFLKANGKPFSETNNDISKRFRLIRQYAYVVDGGFYWLRHTFATVAGASTDQVAVNFIMGHVDPTMAAAYRETIEDDRLLKVVNTVHQWLR